jgi:hypothetical protein
VAVKGITIAMKIAKRRLRINVLPQETPYGYDGKFLMPEQVCKVRKDQRYVFG